MNKKSILNKTLGSFTFTIFSAILLGLFTGGIPYYSTEISKVALLIAMTISLTHINIKNIHVHKKELFIPFLLNYGLLTIITLCLGFFFPVDIWHGFVIIAAVPPAIATIPITKILNGDITYSLISTTVLYLISLVLTPIIILIFLGKTIDIFSLVQTIILLLFLPLLISQYLRRFSIPTERKTYITNSCFFILIFVLVGQNRLYLSQEFILIFWIAIASLIRTFGTGVLIKIISSRLGISYKKQIPLIIFSVVKNEGFAIILALSLFGDIAVLPPIIGLIFEMLWIGCFESKLC